MRGDEPQRPVGAVPYSDTRSGQNFRRVPAFVTNDYWPVCLKNWQPILGARDTECASEAAGPGYRGDPADQDTARSAIRFGDDVQALVHAIDQIDICPPRGAEDHSRARSNTAVGMGSLVVQPQIGLYFDDGRRQSSTDQYFPQQAAGDCDGVAGVEGFRENG